MNNPILNDSTADRLSNDTVSNPNIVTGPPIGRSMRPMTGGHIVRDVTGAATSREVMIAAGLDWQVMERALSDCNDAGEDCRPVEGYKSVRRADTMGHLGVVGSGYKVCQNAEVFDFMDALVKEGLAQYHGAGAFRGGRTIFVQVRYGDSIDITPGDTIDPYFLLANTHDGSGALNAVETAVHVVCKNTLAMALADGGKKRKKVSIRHTGDASYAQRLDAARERFAIGRKVLETHVETLRTLTRKPVETDWLNSYFTEVFAIKRDEKGELSTKAKNQLDAAFQAFETSPGNQQPAVRGSRWAAINAVTYLVDHKANTRISKDLSDDQRAFQEEHNRLESAMFGQGALKKSKAYELAMVGV